MSGTASTGNEKRRGRLWPAALLAVAAVAALAGALILAFGETGSLSRVPAPTETSMVDTRVASSTTTVGASGSSQAATTAMPAIGSGQEVGAPTTTVLTHAIGRPERIVIAAIGVDSEVVEVGLEESGEMEVPPFGLAGWYGLGPVPGEAGPAVIVAHVDSRTGPDVFFRLDELEPGDEILVYGFSKEPALFEVEGSETSAKDELPAERIWNPDLGSTIRLITCAGEFDRASRHYLSNLIVYGRLVR